MGKENPPKPSGRAFASLEPRVRHIPEAAVRKKWKKLGPGPQDNVKQLLLSLKSQAMVSSARTTKLAGAGPIVEEVAQKLMDKLPRMPFPPRTEESYFDFEATLDRVRLLEAQLTSNVNSMHLLRAQIKKEEKMLQRDRQELDDLIDGSKCSEAIRNKQKKSLHPLAAALDTEMENSGFNRHCDSLPTKLSVSELEADPEVAPLLKQLHNHLESMDNNAAGVGDMEDSLKAAQAALDTFISTTLDRRQYKQLYGLDLT